MYVIMNRVYFTSLYVESQRPSYNHGLYTFLHAGNTGAYCGVDQSAYPGIENMRYHLLRTKGLNWLNADHCKAMLAFIQYLIRVK